MAQHKTLTCITDTNSGDEAIYVDGVLKQTDVTIYACEIAEHAGTDPVLIRHEICELIDGLPWPEKLEDVPITEGN